MRLGGLHGGHSGTEIHLQRGNAIKLLARILHAVALEIPFQLFGLQGGNKRNAIPREATALLVVRELGREAFAERVRREFEAVRAEYAVADPGLALSLDEAALPSEVWTADSHRTALDLLEALPHGVLAMSLDIPGLVETSSNVATVQVQGGALQVGCATRSSVGSALRAARRRMRSIARLAHASIEQNPGYPGWKPNLQSPLLGLVGEVHAELFGKKPDVRAVHAGLECGIIGEKVPGMDMLSVGPQIDSPHSPQEHVKISSVADFWRLLTASLERLAA